MRRKVWRRSLNHNINSADSRAIMAHLNEWIITELLQKNELLNIHLSGKLVYGLSPEKVLKRDVNCVIHWLKEGKLPLALL